MIPTRTIVGVDTDRDEELARALQAQFRIEAEAASSASARLPATPTQPSRSSMGNHNSNTTGTTSGSVARSNYGARPHPASRSYSDSMPSMNYVSPSSRHKRTNSGSSPDNARTTSTTTTPSSASPSNDRQYSNLLSLYESHLRQLEANNNNSSRNSSGLDALASAPPAPSTSTSTRSSPRGSPRGSPRNSFHNNVSMLDDEAMARRLEQELQDAELAASLERAERAAPVHPTAISVPSATVGNTGNNNTPQLGLSQRDGRSTTTLSSASSSWNNSNSCRGRTLHFVLRMLVVLLMAGITFIVYVAVFGKQVSDSLDPATWLPGYPESDPSLGSVGKNAKWIPLDGEVEGNGLTLSVLNNLASGSDWDEYFNTAIYDWDNGTPDAVTFSLRTMDSYDPDCQAVRRAMKVCNGNYGPTDWRGVNQILLQDNYIVTSLAKMNDYYLEGTDIAQKQYTMCHELGHGLGLGHVDENFYNSDLGNCMDYTERPQNNMHPDDTNYQALADLYGVVYVSTSAEMDVPENRLLTEEEFEKYASHLLDPIETSSKWKVAEDSNGTKENARRSSRLLLKTETTEHHERDLGNGYSIRTSILLA
ncbi:hypothetical protein ACHAXH_002558 [Discostella pseudostelligera]